MHSKARLIGALLSAGAALALTTAAAAEQENATTGTDVGAPAYFYAWHDSDAESRTLAHLYNQIPSKNVVPIAMDGFLRHITTTHGEATERRWHRELRAAMDKATIADEDRANGQSEDQSSLSDYLRHLGIDPDTVMAVHVDVRRDRQNPHVTVYYRRGKQNVVLPR